MMEKNNIKKLENNLDELIDYVNDFFNFLPIPVCDLSPTFYIIQANKAFEDLSAFDLLEIVGEPIEKLFLEKEKLKETISLLDKKNFLGNQEFTLLRKDGKEKIVNTFWAKRKEKGYFLAMIDITSLKKIHQEMEEQINLRTKELREKLEELENFQKITIGRELKMVALKEEIQRLKKEIEELKKQREAN